MKDSEKEINQFEKNLITFLKLFHNRPLHLAKYFIENNSFNDDFKNNISNNRRLEMLSEKYQIVELPNIYFLNFKEMLKFFENLSNELNIDSESDREKLTDELNNKLDSLLKLEKYEEAIKVRDYMIQNSIQRKIQ